MKTIKVIYYNIDLTSKGGKERTEKIIKPLYWSEDVENWQYFDGEIEIERADIFGCNDGAIIRMKTREFTEEVITDALVRNSKIRMVSIEKNGTWERLK